jgi:hypothetical protein
MKSRLACALHSRVWLRCSRKAARSTAPSAQRGPWSIPRALTDRERLALKMDGMWRRRHRVGSVDDEKSRGETRHFAACGWGRDGARMFVALVKTTRIIMPPRL